MKSLTLFLPFIEPFVAGCPKAMARRALVDAAIEFCERTELVQDQLDPINTRANVREYDVTVSSQKAIVGIRRAWFKGTELRPATNESVSGVAAFRSDVAAAPPVTGDPQAFFQSSPNVLGVDPVPATSESKTLTVRASTRPRRGATQLDDLLFEDWAEAVAAGALYRLHATPGQAFTDQGQAGRRLGEFEVAITRARAQGQRGRSRAELRVQPVPFA